MSLPRHDGNGSPHDVHHGVSDDRQHRAQRLEASDVGLRVVFCVSPFPLNSSVVIRGGAKERLLSALQHGLAVVQLLHGGRRGHAQLLHQDHH